MAQTTKQIADRGKWAEKEVQKHLEFLNTKFMGFAFDRQPDARAAGGRLKAALCDFLWWWKPTRNGPSISGLLEVKETRQDSRIARDKLDQLPRMRKVRYAGGVGLVLIYHSAIEKWRCAPLEFFDGEIPPSWDLSALPLYDTLAAALNESGVMPL
jgi:hypothetical protein